MPYLKVHNMVKWNFDNKFITILVHDKYSYYSKYIHLCKPFSSYSIRKEKYSIKKCTTNFSLFIIRKKFLFCLQYWLKLRTILKYYVNLMEQKALKNWEKWGNLKNLGLIFFQKIINESWWLKNNCTWIKGRKHCTYTRLLVGTAGKKLILQRKNRRE